MTLIERIIAVVALEIIYEVNEYLLDYAMSNTTIRAMAAHHVLMLCHDIRDYLRERLGWNQ